MKNYNNFIGKWCLYKQMWSSSYTNIFIHDIKDGIVKYTPETNLNYIGYEDLSFFKNCLTFRVNPIQSNSLNQEPINTQNRTNSYNEHIGGCGWNINDSSERDIKDLWDEIVSRPVQSRKIGCDHEWYETLLTSYPPIRSRTCKKCGRQAHMENAKWIEGY